MVLGVASCIGYRTIGVFLLGLKCWVRALSMSFMLGVCQEVCIFDLDSLVVLELCGWCCLSVCCTFS